MLAVAVSLDSWMATIVLISSLSSGQILVLCMKSSVFSSSTLFSSPLANWMIEPFKKGGGICMELGKPWNGMLGETSGYEPKPIGTCTGCWPGGKGKLCPAMSGLFWLSKACIGPPVPGATWLRCALPTANSASWLRLLFAENDAASICGATVGFSVTTACVGVAPEGPGIGASLCGTTSTFMVACEGSGEKFCHTYEMRLTF